MWIAFLPRLDLGTDATLTRLRANALLNNTTGSSNIAIGYNAGSQLNSDSNTSISPRSVPPRVKHHASGQV